ncbi:hypothetical protein ABIE67_010182 [Streptomyces sp. V4I8]
MGRRKVRQQPIRRHVAGECSGIQLDHRDGSMSCSRGVNCPGVALPHRGWADYSVYGECMHCRRAPALGVRPRFLSPVTDPSDHYPCSRPLPPRRGLPLPVPGRPDNRRGRARGGGYCSNEQ